MEDRFNKIERDLILIRERNSRVEEDKAWETSLFRKVAISLLTYIVMVIFMLSINNDNLFLNATIPTLAFFLSTLSLSFIKTFWIKRSKSSI